MNFFFSDRSCCFDRDRLRTSTKNVTLLLRDGHEKNKTKRTRLELKSAQPDEGPLERFILSKPASALVKHKLKLLTMVFCCIDVSSYKQDSVWSWFICFCTTTCMILTIGFTFSLGVLLPVFMDSFKENREKTGKLKYPSK